jgi:hypothetical protein
MIKLLKPSEELEPVYGLALLLENPDHGYFLYLDFNKKKKSRYEELNKFIQVNRCDEDFTFKFGRLVFQSISYQFN